MPNIDFSFAKDPNTLALAIVLGILPAVLWVLFWIAERGEYPERKSLLAKAFVFGVIGVVAVLPIETWISTHWSDPTTLTVLWAASEELVKCAIFMFFVYRSRYINEPVDYAIYIMVLALGFAGFENVLYLLDPLQSGNAVVLTLAGTTRYMGTTLLHALATGFFGLGLGFAYFKGVRTKIVYGTLGLGFGILLHSFFNLTIGERGAGATFQLFGLLWAVAIVGMLVFELERRMGSPEVRMRHKEKVLTEIERSLASPKPRIVRHGLGMLRSMYAAYLMNEGDTPKAAEATAAKLVTDGMTQDAMRGTIAMLRGPKVQPEPNLPTAP